MTTLNVVPTSESHRRVLYLDLRQENRGESTSELIKDLRRLDLAGTKIAERIAKATLKGIGRYRKDRKKSRRGGGAGLSKMPLHLTRSLATGLEELDGITDDLERALPARKLRSKILKNR